MAVQETGSALPILPNKHPATAEVARTGVSEFTRLAGILSPKARRVFVSSDEMRRNFVGTAPEVGSFSSLFSEHPGEVRAEITEAAKTRSKTHLVVTLGQHLPIEKQSSSFINLLAAAQVAANYPEFFPQLKGDELTAWFQDPKNWMENVADPVSFVRLGLLSGFPYSAARHHSEYHRISLKLITPFDQQVAEFLGNYILGQVKRDDKTREKIKGLLTAKAGGLTEYQEELIHSARSIPSQAIGRFISYGDPEDAKYITEADRIYQGSGIKKA